MNSIENHPYLLISSKCIGDFYQLTIFDGTSISITTSKIDYSEYSILHLDKENNYSLAPKENSEKNKEKLILKFQILYQPYKNQLFIDDSCMSKLNPIIADTASFIKKMVLCNRQIFLRYNADTDGIISALFVKLAIEKFAQEHKINPVFVEISSPPAIYTKPQSISEMKYLQEMNFKPICILLDHSANVESIQALTYIKSENFPIILIDHHPPAQNIKELTDFYISPFAVDVKESKYTTGLLCFELSKAICNSADVKMLEYSLLADASTFAKTTDYTVPLSIDYFAQTNSKASLDDYLPIINDANTAQKLYFTADKILKDCANNAWEKSQTITSDNYSIILCDLNGIIKKRTYPSKGMVVNLVQKKAEEVFSSSFSNKASSNVVSICYVGDSIGLRASADAIKNGFDANHLIEELKEKFPRLIRSGGGHKGAASLLVFDEADRIRVREIVIEFTKQMIK